MVKCHRCDLKTNRKHWMPEDCIKALKAKLDAPKMVRMVDHGPTHNRDLPRQVIMPLNDGYTVSSWCPTDDPADSKPEQIHIQFHMPAGVPPLILRLKSRQAAEHLTGLVSEYARKVWPG